jgi:hypothetical protein
MTKRLTTIYAASAERARLNGDEDKIEAIQTAIEYLLTKQDTLPTKKIELQKLWHTTVKHRLINIKKHRGIVSRSAPLSSEIAKVNNEGGEALEIEGGITIETSETLYLQEWMRTEISSVLGEKLYPIFADYYYDGLTQTELAKKYGKNQSNIARDLIKASKSIIDIGIRDLIDIKQIRVSEGGERLKWVQKYDENPDSGKILNEDEIDAYRPGRRHYSDPYWHGPGYLSQRAIGDRSEQMVA